MGAMSTSGAGAGTSGAAAGRVASSGGAGGTPAGGSALGARTAEPARTAGPSGSQSGGRRRSGGGSSPAGEPVLSAGLTGVNLTLEELCGASGLRPDQVKELERYGLLVGRAVGGTAYFDEEAGVVAGLAAEFLRFGVEARHLRMYKTAAEREAGFFEQVVMPLLKQRNPEARQQAAHTLGELSRLGAGLRTAMLRVALRDHTGG